MPVLAVPVPVRMAGELVEDAGIGGAGDDGGDRGVAAGAGRRGDAVRGDPRGGGLVGFGLAEQLAEGQVQLDLGGLPGPVRQPPGGDQPAAGFLQRVVVPLAGGAQVLGPGPAVQGVQHGLQRGRGRRGQVTVEAGVALVVAGQLQPPLAEPVALPARVGIGPGGAGPDLLGEGGQVGQVRAAGGGGQQDPVGLVAGVRGQLAGPVTEVPRP